MKVMTAILAIENGNMSDIVTVGKEVLTMYGSNIYIELNEKMKLEDLLYGLLMRSGNDAAVVIANHIGGTLERFVEMMNEKAKELGMINTIYRNPHGLDEDTQNYSTAKDQAILSSYANTLDKYREISKTRKKVVSTENKTYVWYNRNKLLSLYEYATGGKTGYTPLAGRTLVTTASKDSLNLTAVTLYDSDEYNDHKKMYEYGYLNYKNYVIIDKDNFVKDIDYNGNMVYVKNSFIYPLTNIEKNNIKIITGLYELNDYRDNTVVGEVKVLLNEKIIYKDDIYVSKGKEKLSWLEKIIKFIKSLFD